MSPDAETPLRIADDVHLVRSLLDDGGPMRVAINSMVITGAEPVLVDTGAPAGRAGWWRQVEQLVDPAEVRWIFLSHDDVDHYGNLVEALRRCRDAVVVSSWLLGRRLASAVPLPLDRCRWLNDGEHFTAGDRDLLAVRPPAYDAPSTRGLFDVRSGVYWASDCFGCPVPHPVDDVSQLDRDVWEDGFLLWHRLLSPWATSMDTGTWRREIARIAALEPMAIASCHGPLVRRADVASALDLLAELPGLPEAPMPGQAQFTALLA